MDVLDENPGRDRDRDRGRGRGRGRLNSLSFESQQGKEKSHILTQSSSASPNKSSHNPHIITP